MGHLITIEKWSENLEEVTLSRWLIAPGDPFAPGDLLCEIITDKVTFEYQLETGGLLLRQLCAEQSVLPVGYVIAFIGEPGEALPEGTEARNAELLAEHSRRHAAALDLDFGLGAPEPPAAAPAAGPVRATPAARRAAREHGVSVEEVAAWRAGAGPVTEEDVHAFVAR